MNDRISASCENTNSTTLKKSCRWDYIRNETFSISWKEETFYDETIGDGITSCYEMFIVCCGYKSHSLGTIKDQLYNVKSRIKTISSFSGHSHSLPQYCVNDIVSHSCGRMPKLMTHQRENVGMLKRQALLCRCSVVQGHENYHFSWASLNQLKVVFSLCCIIVKFNKSDFF